MLLVRLVLKRMRLILSAVLVIGTIFIVASCGGSSSQGLPTGEWYKQSDFDGAPRSNASCFTINGNPYIGGGFYSTSASTIGRFLTDYWVYSPEHDSWTAIAPFPGPPRSFAAAFSVNGKGYVGLGNDGVKSYKDFWEYDPGSDSWTRIADFPGTARYGASAFSINNMGYVGSGLDTLGATKDFWAYDGATWSKKASVGTKRYNSFVFVIDGIAYLGGGVNNGTLDYSFYSYDPLNDVWTAQFDLLDDTKDNDPNDKGYNMAHQLSSTFVINGMGYVVGGNRVLTSADVSCWQYNPSTKIWTKETDMSIGYSATYAAARDGAVGYSIGDRGYVATGRSAGSRLDDVWAFDPTQYHVN